MKRKSVKILLVVLGVFLILVLSLFVFYLTMTANVKLDTDKLNLLDRKITFYDKNDNEIFTSSNGHEVVSIEDVPIHVKNSFIAIEDKRFYDHNGIDFKGLLRATFKNVKNFSYVEGGSTITQQLIKNTQLSSEKTIKRKLSEIKLSRILEKNYKKDKILEMYLNSIYFGENCYGISSASKKYFGKTPSELTISEGAILAGLIKAPSFYSPISNYEKSIERRNIVLKELKNQNLIDDKEYEISVNEEVILSGETQNFDYFYLLKKELNPIIDDNPYKKSTLNVYTNFDKTYQDSVETYFENNSEYNESAIIIDKDGKILAYVSNVGEVNRQIGSTIKPLLVYAPAIENNVISPETPILDEKTNFNGYSPSNFNDKYYGYVSAKQSLAKSLNVCATKILNYTGIENAKEYLNKTDIKLTENDNSLCLALGATENGSTLLELCSAYSVFQNNGFYQKAYSIRKVEDDKNNVIYKNSDEKTKIFGEDTTCLLNDMLLETVQNGTAKKLSFLDFPLYSKTGTVGNDNGNTDAYSISYNKEILIGVWYGNKKNKLLENSISGGTAPTIHASKIWEKIYRDDFKSDGFNNYDCVEKVPLDLISYNENHKLVRADKFAPKRYIFYGLFKKDNTPKITSDEFSSPKLKSFELSVNSNVISMQLCQAEYINSKIYRVCNNEKTLIYDTKNLKNKNIITDNDLVENSNYFYEIVPYYQYENNVISGETVKTKTIKIPSKNIPKENDNNKLNNDNWWDDELS